MKASVPLSVLELDVLKNRRDELARLSPFIPGALKQLLRFRFVSMKPDGAIECLAERGPDRGAGPL